MPNDLRTAAQRALEWLEENESRIAMECSYAELTAIAADLRAALASPAPEPAANATLGRWVGVNNPDCPVCKNWPETMLGGCACCERRMVRYVDASITQVPPTAPVALSSVQPRDGNRPLPFDRETLGRMVREAWVRWAQTQPSPKSSWLVPYNDLPEADKEADRQIGEAIARWALIGDDARKALEGNKC